MAELLAEPPKAAKSLSNRIDVLRREVIALVANGVEHPNFEFKRAVSILRENLEDRLDFIKLIQGVANSDGSSEKCIIIGGDPKEKRFYPVSNLNEFDHAKLSSILERYLEPVPSFEVFNNLTNDQGEAFVVIVFGEAQPQPVVVKTEGSKPGGKIRLCVGEIWIKRGTALNLASRADIDRMYRLRSEEEAENRARKRFQHFSEISSAQHALIAPQLRLPTSELLVSAETEFKRFVEELIVEKDDSRFNIFLEIARDWIVEGWDSIGVRGSTPPQTMEASIAQANDFFRDRFLPSVSTVVTLGLLIIKYNFSVRWLSSVVDLLIEGFNASRGLQLLKSSNVLNERSSVQWWRPGFEIFVAVRTLAIYAVRRRRIHFLKCILPRVTNRLEIDDREGVETPFLFWPLPTSFDPFSNGELNNGRATFFWNERVSQSWGSYFGTRENFIASSCELEFILEFNSYLATNTIDDPMLRIWTESHGGPFKFRYRPDVFSYRAGLMIPAAEFVFDTVVSGEGTANDLQIADNLFETAFKGRDRAQRVILFGGFLNYLRKWLSEFAFQRMNFSLYVEWGGRLNEAMELHKKSELGQKKQ